MWEDKTEKGVWGIEWAFWAWWGFGGKGYGEVDKKVQEQKESVCWGSAIIAEWWDYHSGI